MPRKTSIAIGSGKGGVGKSTFAASLGVALGRRGVETVLVDADFEGANLHTLCGVERISHTLQDFLSGASSSLDSVLTPVDKQCRLLCGAADMLSIMKPTFRSRKRLWSGLTRCKADAIVIDLPAGTGNQCVDFFLAAHHRVIVMEPDPLSFENGYLFLKSAVYRKVFRTLYHHTELKERIKADVASNPSAPSIPALIRKLKSHRPSVVDDLNHVVFDRPFYLVLNKAEVNGGLEAVKVFRTVTAKNLCIDIRLLTTIRYDPQVRASLVSRKPSVMHSPDSCFSQSVKRSIDALVNTAQPTLESS